jgi:hypothetical protein
VPAAAARPAAAASFFPFLQITNVHLPRRRQWTARPPALLPLSPPAYP